MSQQPPTPESSPFVAPDAGFGMPEGPLVTPLLGVDPPQVGDYWLDARLAATPSGIAYSGHDENNNSVMVLVLSAGAAGDLAARDRFAGEVNQMHLDTVVARGGQGQDQGVMAHKYRPLTDAPQAGGRPPVAPWVALRYDGSTRAVAEANRVLNAVDLSRVSLVGRPSGPSYALHWREQTAPGRSRLWPLPWPGRFDRAGWVSILAAFLLTFVIAALALLLAVLAFQNQPPQKAPPPIPPSQSQSQDQSQSQSQSQSQQSSQSQSQSQSQSPSQSPSQSGSQSQSPSESTSSGQSPTPSKSESGKSPSPSDQSSGAGTPTSNKRLILDDPRARK